MGKENDVILEYLDVKEHFADLFNGTYFNGERAVDAQGLEDSSSVYWDNFQEEAAVLEVLGETMRSSQQQRTVHSERRRDLKKKLKSGNSLRVLAIEHQASVDMSMAWRHMYYDALEYKKQIKECGEYNEKYGLLKPEQKYQNCKLTEEDRLVPVFTACLYLGEEPWNGPRSLKDMMHFKKGDEQWEKLFADYQMNLICVNEMTDISEVPSTLAA